MIENDRPDPIYLADNPALDFLNSVSAPWTTQIEWLENGHDLITWLEQADMLPCDIAMRFRTEFPTHAIDRVTKQARELREWFRKFIKAYSGASLSLDAFNDLQRINRLLKTDDAYRQIVQMNFSGEKKDGGQQLLSWQRERRWRRPEDLLIPIAEAIGEFVCHSDFSKVKNCEGSACTLWFYDISKNHTRRWCSMSICGNRAKAAAHRARKRSEAAS